MTQASDQEAPKFPMDEEPKLQECSLSELRASLVLEQDRAIVAANRSIRAVGLVDEFTGDVKSALIQALETAVAELKDIDPMATTDTGALLEASQRIKSLSRAR